MFTTTGILTLTGGIATAAVMDKLLRGMGKADIAEVLRVIGLTGLASFGAYYTIQFLQEIMGIFL